MKTAALALISVLFLGPLSPTPARADTQTVVDKTYDALILRPLGGFGLLVGAGMSVPAMLLASVNGPEGMREVWEVFVEYPYESTVDRKLGEF